MAGVQSGVMATPQAPESYTQTHGHSGQGRSVGVSSTAVASTRASKATVKHWASLSSYIELCGRRVLHSPQEVGRVHCPIFVWPWLLSGSCPESTVVPKCHL